jgi:hypothetical protein
MGLDDKRRRIRLSNLLNGSGRLLERPAVPVWVGEIGMNRSPRHGRRIAELQPAVTQFIAGSLNVAHDHDEAVG